LAGVAKKFTVLRSSPTRSNTRRKPWLCLAKLLCTYSVRYDQVNAMLLNEFLKEHRKVEQLEKQVEQLSAGLQKVSAQLGASRPAPQMVATNQ
jgi:hypothetical protein